MKHALYRGDDGVSSGSLRLERSLPSSLRHRLGRYHLLLTALAHRARCNRAALLFAVFYHVLSARIAPSPIALWGDSKQQISGMR